MNFLHTVHPEAVALTALGIEIYWYGLILAAAILAGFILTLYIAKKKQVEVNHIYSLFFYFIIFCLIGGRIGHLIAEWGYYQDNLGEILKIWQGGLAVHGVILAGVITLLIYCRIKKLSFWLLGDIMVVALPLMQAIGRWGNYFNQEIFGRPTGLAWGIPIELAKRPIGLADQVYYHPLFLYESLLMLGVFVVLWYLFSSNKLKTGRLILFYFIIFSAIRFVLEFLRIEAPAIGFLNLGQWISVILIAVSWYIWVRFKKASSHIHSQEYKK